MNSPEPIEQTDPELAQLLTDWIEQERYKQFTIKPKGYTDKRCWPVYRFVTVSLNIGRNELCVCGSNRKFKACCGNANN